jgi:hypothetical protein
MESSLFAVVLVADGFGGEVLEDPASYLCQDRFTPLKCKKLVSMKR